MKTPKDHLSNYRTRASKLKCPDTDPKKSNAIETLQSVSSVIVVNNEGSNVISQKEPIADSKASALSGMKPKIIRKKGQLMLLQKMTTIIIKNI